MIEDEVKPTFTCFSLGTNNYFVIVTSFPIGLVKTKSQYGIPRCHLLQPQPAITCSELTLETLEQGVKYVQR